VTIGSGVVLTLVGWAFSYPFLSNADVSECEILDGHFQASAARFSATDGPVLVLQDMPVLRGTGSGLLFKLLSHLTDVRFLRRSIQRPLGTRAQRGCPHFAHQNRGRKIEGGKTDRSIGL
jgi:hypothetical protein